MRWSSYADDPTGLGTPHGGRSTSAACTTPARRRSSSGVLGRRPGRDRGRGEPGRADGDGHLRPGRDLGRGPRRAWVEECGYHCAGPLGARARLRPAGRATGHDAPAATTTPRCTAPTTRTGTATAATPACRWTAMVARHAQPLPGRAPLRDPDRALVAARRRTCSGSTLADAVRHATATSWQLLLSLPVVFYSSWIFFRGAWLALRARTLDMMVLVAVAIGTGWVYSVAATFLIEGEVFYEAAALLAHVRAARPLVRDARPRRRATTRSGRCSTWRRRRRLVIRDGEPVEVPTAEVRGRRPAPDPARREGARSTPRSSRARARSTSRWSPARACRSRRRPGDALIGATINKTGTLRARATAVGVGHRAGADRQARPGGPELEGAGAAARRPRRLLARARRARSAAWRRSSSGTSSSGRPSRRRSCSRSPSSSSPAPTRSAWRRRRRSWSAPASAPSAGSCSRTRSRSSRPPSSTPSSSTRPAR